MTGIGISASSLMSPKHFHSVLQESGKKPEASPQEQLGLGLLLSQIWGSIEGFQTGQRSPKSGQEVRKRA